MTNQPSQVKSHDLAVVSLGGCVDNLELAAAIAALGIEPPTITIITVDGSGPAKEGDDDIVPFYLGADTR